MAVGEAQYITGYLRGVKLIRIQTLEADGDNPVSPVYYKITTPQAVGISMEVEEGESSVLRGGDQVIARIQDIDTIVGGTLTLTNAKFDIEALYHLCGGTLIEETIDLTDYNTGWEMPTIAEQQTRLPVLLEIYVQNFSSSGVQTNWVKYIFGWCIGYAPNIEHNDQEWATPELTIKCSENETQSLPIYTKEYVNALPA